MNSLGFPPVHGGSLTSTKISDGLPDTKLVTDTRLEGVQTPA